METNQHWESVSRYIQWRFINHGRYLVGYTISEEAAPLPVISHCRLGFFVAYLPDSLILLLFTAVTMAMNFRKSIGEMQKWLNHFDKKKVVFIFLKNRFLWEDQKIYIYRYHKITRYEV